MRAKLLRYFRGDFPADELPADHAPLVELIGGTRHLVFESDEGPRIHLPIANTFLRAFAFIVDLLILAILAAIAAWLGQKIDQTFGPIPNDFFFLVVLIYALPFFLYPLLAEFAFHGRSLGAILMGLDVVDARGGSLTWGQITLRRVASGLEPALAAWLVFALPIAENNLVAKIALMSVAISLQSLHVYLSPARQRLSDAMANIVVVERTPRHDWLPALPTAVAEGFKLSPVQLDMYGSYELHVMEQCLHAWELHDQRPLKQAAKAIRAKLALPTAGLDDHTIVLSVYNLLRADLEQKQRAGMLRLRKRPGLLQKS